MPRRNVITRGLDKVRFALGQQILPKQGRAALQRELVAGSTSLSRYLAALTKTLNRLPIWIDDAECDFGLDIYQRMLNDPAVASALAAIKTSVLGDGISLLNPIPAPTPLLADPEQQAQYDAAEEIKDSIEENLDRLSQPLEAVFGDMLDYLAFGHAIAEQVYTFDGNKVVLAALKVKPRLAYCFVVTKMMDCAGVVSGPAESSGYLKWWGEVEASEVIPREKFWVLVHDPKAGDPRGTSLLRPAYNAWYLKQQTWPAYLKYNIQFGTPSVLGKLAAEGSLVDLSNDAGAAITPEEAMVEKLVAWTSGTAVVVPNGAEIQLIESKGDGSNFVNAIDLYNREITRAILIAIRATMEAEYSSKADSGSALEVLGQFGQMIKRRIEAAFYHDVIQPLVRFNFGNEAADTLAPMVSLSDLSPGDVEGKGNMIANLARAGLIHTSQLPGIDRSLDLPERDMEALQAEEAERKETEADRRAMLDLGFPTPNTGAEVESEE